MCPNILKLPIWSKETMQTFVVIVKLKKKL